MYRIVCGYIIFYIFWRFTPTGYINFAVYADRIHIFCGLCRPDTNIWRFMPTGYIDLAVYANRINRFGGLCRPDTYIWRFMPTGYIYLAVYANPTGVENRQTVRKDCFFLNPAMQTEISTKSFVLCNLYKE